MKELSSTEIRQMFLDFFATKGHFIEPSQSLIPKNDPTLLWINSGVATLKKYFDGTEVPKNPRITNAQKSIRTNDIENVGKTARHHTLFEMMGNFSVGDYFKEDAIAWAWELLTSPDWYAIPAEKLYVTVYPKDQDARAIWEKQPGFIKDHIYEEESNFWDIGEGPSGPDSEIFFDRGPEYQNLPDDDPEMYPGGENERYLEIWNIVFSQFNHLPGLTDNSQYPELPHKNIDTGMGLERVVSVFQNARTNFETDLFLPIIQEVEKIANVKYGDAKETDVSFKVIADHIRAITFAIGDGATPSNEGRGYVIRRLLRRAVLHGRKLGIETEFLTKLVPVVGNIMKSYYPEVLENEAKITAVVKKEENRFSETLNSGMKLLNDVIATTKDKTIDGKTAFKLYDTYGFPLELTIEEASNFGISVDEAGFNAEMEKQRERARSSRTNTASMGEQNAVLIDLKTASDYLGWTTTEVDDARLKNIIVGDELLTEVSEGKAMLIFDKTPFYAEMGGQVADTGKIVDQKGNVVAEVVDVQKAPNGQNLHFVNVLSQIATGDIYDLQVDLKKHVAVSRNHTATHLLDQALRNIIGGDIHQEGSLVEADYMRFDFNHDGPVSEDILNKIEDEINRVISESQLISWEELPIEEAKKLDVVAVFDDKYDDVVRVVTIGDYNKEFDGGTHANNTSELGLFKIVSESGIGAGVRRIEAVTGYQAFKVFKDEEEELKKIVTSVKAQGTTDVVEKVLNLQADLKAANKQIESLEDRLVNATSTNMFNDVKEVNGYSYVASQMQVTGMDALRKACDNWKQNGKSDILVLAAEISGKANLLVAVKEDKISDAVNANTIIKFIAPFIQGGGGGRKEMAQAGGKKPSGITEALNNVEAFLGQI